MCAASLMPLGSAVGLAPGLGIHDYMHRLLCPQPPVCSERPTLDGQMRTAMVFTGS